MPRQPNKPGGDFKPDGETRRPGEEQAVKNQATVSPDDYPEVDRDEEVPDPAFKED